MLLPRRPHSRDPIPASTVDGVVIAGSPSAAAPEGMWASIVELAHIAINPNRNPAHPTPERTP
jgi:hypothetical protein